MGVIDPVKYVITASTLKLFSNSPRFYRFLGNNLGGQVRVQGGLPRNYQVRAKTFLDLCEKHQAVRNGARLLEIGTGWLHWETIVLRLFFDVQATLFDVWDNRQLEPLRNYVEQFGRVVGQDIELDEVQQERIAQIISAVSEVTSFEQLYQVLNFRYLVDGNGSLDAIEDESVDFVYSYNVLEHIGQDIIANSMNDFYRVLRPGGYSIHTIDMTDHLISFAKIRNMHRKHYMRYTNQIWQRYFENNLQYINRIQRSEWLNLFANAGFKLAEEGGKYCDVDNMKISETFKHMDKQDLECRTLVVVHRKPESSQ